MASFIICGASKSCLRVASNITSIKLSGLTPQLSRAFCVAPLRAASAGTTPHSPCTTSSSLLTKVSSNHDTSTRSSSSGDHVNLWTAERVLSASLLASIPAAMLIPSPPVETFLALSLTLHSHWGIEALVHDYIRPSVFGAVIPRLSVSLVYFISVMTFGGLCYFIYTDVGLINAISMLWKL